MKQTMLTILAILGFAVVIGAAATKITVNQILGSQTTGQVLTVTTAGVAGWVTPVAPVVNTVPNFADAEVPGGTVNGTNAAFTLLNKPIGASLNLFRNGVNQQVGTDYTLSGSAITFTNIPQTGDILQAWYRF